MTARRRKNPNGSEWGADGPAAFEYETIVRDALMDATLGTDAPAVIAFRNTLEATPGVVRSSYGPDGRNTLLAISKGPRGQRIQPSPLRVLVIPHQYLTLTGPHSEGAGIFRYALEALQRDWPAPGHIWIVDTLRTSIPPVFAFELVPTHAGHPNQRSTVNPQATGGPPPPDTISLARVRQIIAERREAGIPEPDWDVFETNREPGIELLADDDANIEAERLGLEMLTDEDIRQLPEAQLALRETIRRADVEQGAVPSFNIIYDVDGTVLSARRGPSKTSRRNPPRGVRPQKVIAQLQKETRPEFKGKVIGSVEDLLEAIVPYLQQRAHEWFVVLFVNIRNGLVGYTEFSSGSLASVAVDPSGVFREAITAGASGVFTIHNHPSGDPTPSEDDFALWERLREVGKLVGIPVVDNLVVGEKRVFSETLKGQQAIPAAVAREVAS